MPDREKVITHLMIIRTWAEFSIERDLQFFTRKHLEDIAQWSADALALLKEQDEKLKEYEKLSKTLFKIDKYFRIKDLQFLVDGIENGSIVVLQDDGHFIGCTPIKETTIKIRRL